MPKRQNEVNNNGLSAENILIPDVYKEIFLDNYRYFILSSGRISGKTSILVALWWIYFNKYPDRDIVILQATATEIKDSIINEIEKFLINSGFDVGESQANEFYIPRSHDTIEKSGHTGVTKFYPITDSKGGQRSRGINTKNKISLVLYEEAQKNRDANVLEQSVITFIRQIDTIAKLVIVGNSETAGHWFVDYVNDKRQSEEWKYIYANCYDIWNLLNEDTRNYIENFKKVNETEFKRVFLGDIYANSSNVVFPQFSRAECFKRSYEIPTKYITMLFVGIDHATANDTFAAVPVAVRLLHADRAVQNARKNMQEFLAEAEAFEDLVDQMVNNHIDTPEWKSRLHDGIAVPLTKIANESFTELEKRLIKFRTAMESDDWSALPGLKTAAATQFESVVVQLDAVLAKMLQMEDFNEAIEELRSIIKKQEKMESDMKAKQKESLEDLL